MPLKIVRRFRGKADTNINKCPPMTDVRHEQINGAANSGGLGSQINFSTHDTVCRDPIGLSSPAGTDRRGRQGNTILACR